MSDGFDFTRPERREPKGFEPPPWEQEAFDELNRRREESPADAVEAGASASSEAVAGDEGDLNEASAAPEPATDVSGAEPVAPSRGVNDGEVVVMLAGLAAQEPSAQKSIHAVAFSTSAVMATFGLVLVVWGIVALIRSGQSGRVGVIGGSLFFFFGMAAVTFAVWLTVRTLRQRGVL